MLNLDEKYKVGKKFPMKDFIPKNLKPTDKKKIKDNVKSCTLAYQIIGEEIRSVINNEYNVQTIQFYDFELVDMKIATYIANMYQTIIKSPCVLRLYDNNKEVYSFALKRLNQTDNTQIVLTDSLLTNDFCTTIPSSDIKKLETLLTLDNIINKQNKVTTYLEMYVKAYIYTNDKIYARSNDFLKRKDIWYSESKVRDLYANLRKLELLKLSLLIANVNIEKIRINKEIRNLLKKLEVL